MENSNTYIVKKVEKPHDIVTSVPGSKSITNRALLLAALANGTSVLHGVLFSDDSRHFMQALIDLGFFVAIDEANATVTIVGAGGEIPCANSRRDGDVDATVYVGSAGTAARFLTAFLGLSEGRYRMDASEQMKKRPMRELLEALEEMGTEIIYEEEPYHFPFIIGGFDCKRSSITIDIEKSSQFLSALLITSVLLPQHFMIGLTGIHGMAYVNMTLRMMSQFGVAMEKTISGSYRRRSDKGYDAKDYVVEPDISAACYFYALSPLLKVSVKVKNVHMNCLQGDIKFLNVLDRMGCSLEDEPDGVKMYPPREHFSGGSFDLASFSDQALTLAAIAPYASSKVCIMNVGHIRYQECNRIDAILQNLLKMGVLAICEEDNIFILPGKPKACEIETYEDHRVAMAFSLPGTVAGDMVIKNPSCTRKTFENYFEVLENSVY
ncbi:MAG: 3-phosphoshikimate 1-carboxyvinyltransferase [Agathobacter sp.]|nr:3-phosphoshikimate 1-carboxyvinyltransferase [Agathobacter sp.]